MDTNRTITSGADKTKETEKSDETDEMVSTHDTMVRGDTAAAVSIAADEDAVERFVIAAKAAATTNTGIEMADKSTATSTRVAAAEYMGMAPTRDMHVTTVRMTKKRIPHLRTYKVAHRLDTADIEGTIKIVIMK